MNDVKSIGNGRISKKGITKKGRIIIAGAGEWHSIVLRYQKYRVLSVGVLSIYLHIIKMGTDIIMLLKTLRLSVNVATRIYIVFGMSWVDLQRTNRRYSLILHKMKCKLTHANIWDVS